jgi:hypothetical protein
MTPQEAFAALPTWLRTRADMQALGEACAMSAGARAGGGPDG